MKLRIWPLPLLIASLFLLNNCDKTRQQERMVSELMELDREFARQSVEMGSHQAFLKYIDEHCVILRPNRNPVIGRNKIVEMYSNPDTSFSLRWEPSYADISKTGDLGYTYGIYTIEMDSPEGNAVTKQGTYVTIWKKDQKGDWKFVLDTGNQGLGKKKEGDD
jgi:ketosteroid isomerase-like protein